MKFFVVGTGRCGTTLLWRMLNCHPDLYVFRETHWIVPLSGRFASGMFRANDMLDVVMRTNHVTGFPVTELNVDEFKRSRHWQEEACVADFVDGIGYFLAESEGKRMWADKTPDYGAHLTMLQRLWPQAKFIHLIRNGIQTARSMSRHIGYQALASIGCDNWSTMALDYSPPPNDLSAAPLDRYPKLWHDRLTSIRKQSQLLVPGSYIEIFHEEVMNDPRSQLLRIAKHAGLEPVEKWLDQAGSMIEAGRGIAHVSDFEMAAHFNHEQRRLLADLGYETFNT